MPCEPYKNALVEAAATGAEPQGELRAHLAACAACRGAFAEEQSLFSSIDASLHATANVEMPPSLLPRVRARLDQAAAPQSRWIPAWAAVAASVALFIGFLSFRGVRFKTNERPIDSNQVASSVLPVESPASRPGNPPTEHLLYDPARRHRPNQANPSPDPEEPRAFVPAEQPDVIARLLDGLRRGEVKGEVLLADGSGHQSQDLQIVPLTVAPIDVKALDGAQPGVR
jgi:hypothetical protein